MAAKTELRKGRLLVLAVVLVLVIAALIWYFFLRDKPPQNPDDLWPEQGEVIAVIEGKEYRYDPIYLYRLTNACFAEDPDKPITDIFGHGPETFSDGILFGTTQGEAAVCLELLYKEAQQAFGEQPIKDSVIEVYNDRDFIFHYMRTMRSEQYKKPRREEILARHRDAKFFPLQADELFAKDLYPYIKKFAYIDTLVADWEPATPKWGVQISGLEEAEYYALKSKEGRKTLNPLIGQNLLKKYNVEMLE